MDILLIEEVIFFLEDYCVIEEVEIIVVGEFWYFDGRLVKIYYLVVGFVRKLEKIFFNIKVELYDECFSFKVVE